MVMSILREGILAIGGLDPSGGAGVTRDAVTAAQLGSDFSPVVTAIAIQDDRDGVSRVESVPAATVLDQVGAALTRRVAAVKLGMLASAEVIDSLGPVLRQLSLPVVLDPVLAASRGGALLAPDGLEALKALRDVVTVITPNRTEARALGILDPGAHRDQGWTRLVVTGGDEDGPEAIDHFSGPEGEHELVAPRIVGRCPRGTGCTFATATTVALARGLDPLEAVRFAKGAVTRAIAAASHDRLGSVASVGASAGHPFE